MIPPIVVVREILDVVHRPGEETASEWRIGHEAHVELAAGLNVTDFGIARPERIFHLQRDDGMHFSSSTDRVGAGLRKADVTVLALFDQLRHGAYRFLNRDFGIDARHAKDIETVDAESLQALLAVLRHIFL